MEYMVQCTLRKSTKDGVACQTAWLNEKEGLRVGAVVELKSETEGEQQGWEVVLIGNRMPKETVQERSRDWANTRKASDI